MNIRSAFIALLASLSLILASNTAQAQSAPKFMQETYPSQALEAALQDLGALQTPSAALTPKIRELVGLSVAATIPCQYCVYYHTKAATRFGASSAEIKETLAMAAQVRKWSTVLNGSLYDMDAFRREVDSMFAGN